MGREKEPIIWEGSIVGYIEDMVFDMFDLYGTWTSAGTAETERFLKFLAKGEQLWIKIGIDQPSTGTVEYPPDNLIDIKLRRAS